MTYQNTVESIASSSGKVYGKIKRHVAKTMCLPERASGDLFFKTENFQKTGSFKIRGAMSKLIDLAVDTPIVTASSGNHGIACSHAAMTTGHSLTVVLPENVSKDKLAKIRSYGTKTVLHPGDSGMAELKARELSISGDYVYVSPYNDPIVIAGQGTIGFELLEQLPEIENIFISLGGGGLVTGIGAVLKAAKPDIKIFGVSAKHSAALAASIRAGKVVKTVHYDTLADGCAGGIDEETITLPIAIDVIDQLIECSEDDIAHALRCLAWTENMVVEGAAALAYAGYLKKEKNHSSEKSVIVLCGANFDLGIIKSVLNQM